MAGGGARGNLLDPAAAEFRPETAHRFAVLASCHQLHYPLPPPPPPQVPSVLASRAVMISMVPRHLGEAEVRAAMEAFGRVQAVDVGALAAEGVVIVHYYDLRSAQAVVAAAAHGLVYLSGGWGWFGGWGVGANHFSAIWAQFAAAAIDEPNQGFIFVLNSDSAFSCTALAQIFGAFGVLKDVKVVPSKQQHLVLVEFYDKRDAGRAMLELNGKEIDGRRLFLQFGATETQTIRSNTLRNEKNREVSLPPRLARGSLKDGRWLQSSELRQVGKPAPCFVNAAKPSAKTSHSAIVSAEKWSRKSLRQNHCYVPSPPPSSPQEPSTSKRRGNWKKFTKTKEEDSGRFLFKEIDTEASRQLSPRRDSRTTVMIKNIPNKYSQKLLLSLLDDHCVECNDKIRDSKEDEPYSAYDFLYLPIDFNNKCNMGYGFVNLTSPAAALRLYRSFHRQPWQAFNSRKICQVTYARLQGLEALKEHFRSSRFTCDCDEFMPAVFYPPRDGEKLTEPVPVAGRRARATEDGNSR
ncbi:protein terminal ear1 homolog [Zingiber officinale]|uniref:RRM domain-containing protein n=1 Tax=Zingiber officinale TaxID=94328 RepID=A0A8J5HPS3_ZINOF|nr:protein terminal ear1 homolog [Zingiber officinale]KAG6528750.1 hypothetical protein ZIOFF_010935 [Zingiber officinale]